MRDIENPIAKSIISSTLQSACASEIDAKSKMQDRIFI